MVRHITPGKQFKTLVILTKTQAIYYDILVLSAGKYIYSAYRSETDKEHSICITECICPAHGSSVSFFAKLHLSDSEQMNAIKKTINP